MKNMPLKLFALSLLLCAAPAWSAEADHYSVPESEITDITEDLNGRASWLMARALDALNAQGGCSAAAGPEAEEKLYDGLKKIFAIHGRSVLVDEMLDGKLPRTVVLLDDSVYRDWDLSSGVFLSRSQLTLSPSVKVGGKVIGVDKFEHMFGYGLKYYRRHYLKGMDLATVLKLGSVAEMVYLGGNVMATGVFAYADQAANFNGMRFWNHMLQRHDDILGKDYNLGPYVLCEAGRWTLNPEKQLDLSKYIDRSFQENYNCSKFATQSGLDKFNARLAAYASSSSEPRAFTCPVSRQGLEEDAAKYAVPLGDGTSIDHWVINRGGNQKVSYTGEFR